MNTKKNIDRLFQEKFKDFEAIPDKKVWERIKEHKDRKRTVLLPFWYRIAGVAAVAAILFTIGYFSIYSDTSTETIVNTSTEDTKTKTPSTPEDVAQPPIKYDQNNSVVFSAKEKNNTLKDLQNEDLKYPATDSNSVREIHPISSKTNVANTTQPPNTEALQEHKVTNTAQSNTNTGRLVNKSSHLSQDMNGDLLTQKHTQTEHTAIAQQEKQNNSKEHLYSKEQETEVASTPAPLVAHHENDKEKSIVKIGANEQVTDKNPKKKSLLDAVAHSEEKSTENKEVTKKWQVSPNVAPVYYNSLGNGSSIDSQFADNSKSGQVNLSYGVQVSYAINNRLRIRSGVHKVDLGYTTQNIGFSPSSTVGRNLESITYNRNAEIILVADIGRSETNSFVATDINRAPINLTQNEGLLLQQIGYIEVPLEMKYALINKKLGVNMIGGLSTLFLQGNEVSIQAGDFETIIGEANNLSEVSFTGNFGIGVDYSISKQFQLNLEPIFKYQFNAVEGNTTNFRPYYFGIYTGVSIKF
ncbi:hypothetical protein J8281_14305 [Aquimarina sp. U1-2]|uniref:hypothetical protein n=1 Tax=Aquimarina sp. U1-2 TaxID=2823141 RepID=UPI001AECE6F5|nr:hypothetical protein [Aquimarina sp. U1-2]MBP2833364.1 hypothetical protein [Aquimarina sp. U1-2]